MQKTAKVLLQKLKTIERNRVYLYIVVYLLWGILMNAFGHYTEIAKFTYWWQIIPTYILYMVPISILLRGYDFFTQYAYGLVAMALLEFGGYTMGTSYIYPNNFLDKTFGPHVFALAMALFFALYFPLGNMLVNKLYKLLFAKNKK
ncbi:hypothetical protein ATE92_1465 [Ulvibacter sp. MAR_2010_11]|uniref:hypothetical protein n=1 Tax=Ulvibacter sp. MAR_2010_11 TaxID=1250229 RepID=UPI000C2B9510|nr:hypothetical protein [Ulvibacter sp. MAR_2010_11]PKA83313.1 hypothetical protein ATE92_1465 [Ulvibacter sp. MAR_2010_11]